MMCSATATDIASNFKVELMTRPISAITAFSLVSFWAWAFARSTSAARTCCWSSSACISSRRLPEARISRLTVDASRDTLSFLMKSTAPALTRATTSISSTVSETTIRGISRASSPMVSNALYALNLGSLHSDTTKSQSRVRNARLRLSAVSTLCDARSYPSCLRTRSRRMASRSDSSTISILSCRLSMP